MPCSTDEKKMTESITAQTNRRALRKLNTIVYFITRLMVSCGLLMWSVCNFWLNILTYRASEQPDLDWGSAAIMVVVTCVLPFVYGLWLLSRTLGSDSSKKNTAAK